MNHFFAFSFLLSLIQGLEVFTFPSSSYPPTQTIYSSMASLNTSVYIFGGSDGFTYSNAMSQFSFESMSWIQLIQSSENQPTPRIHSVLFEYNSSIYLFGGQSEQGLRNDLWMFDISYLTWTQVPQQGSIPTARAQTEFCLEGSNLYIFGGVSINGIDSNLYK